MADAVEGGRARLGGGGIELHVIVCMHMLCIS